MEHLEYKFESFWVAYDLVNVIVELYNTAEERKYIHAVAEADVVVVDNDPLDELCEEFHTNGRGAVKDIVKVFVGCGCQ